MSILGHSVVAPFSQISLCLNCDYISDAVGDRCPHCGDRGLMNLKKAFEVVRHQHIFDSDAGIERDQKGTFLRCRCGERLEVRPEEEGVTT